MQNMLSIVNKITLGILLVMRRALRSVTTHLSHDRELYVGGGSIDSKVHHKPCCHYQVYIPTD